MSSSSEELPSVRCPGCAKKLKYPIKLGGKQIACPKCGESVVLPVIEAQDNDDFILAEIDVAPSKPKTPPVSIPLAEPQPLEDLGGDDEFRLAPPEPVGKRSVPGKNSIGPDLESKLTDSKGDANSAAKLKKTNSLDLASLDLDNIDLGNFDNDEKPKGNPFAEVPKSKDERVSQAKKTVSNIGSVKNQPAARTDFRYPCKVCGTAMYAEISEVGSNVRCPDCYTEFSIPSPPAGWNRPKNVGPTSLDDGASMPLSAVEGRGVRTSGPTTSTAEAMMAKAAAELEQDDEESRNETYDFDTASWAIRNFGFLRDPSAVVIAIVSGVFLGGALIAGQMVGGMAASKSGGTGATPDEIDSTRSIANNLTLLVLATPVFMGALANGIAVLEASANQLRRIARWPAFNLGEAMGEVIVVAAAFALSALPGALLQWFGSAIGVPNQLAMIVGLLITWLAFPILLLSMLDNQSVSEPISQDVIRSIQSKHNAWGAMYMMSGLGFVSFFFLYLLQTDDRSGLRFTIGFVIPILIFFVFHQYGLLGARISSVTDLGFEEIEDEVDEDQVVGN